VVDVESETTHPGGASNVALNIEALGATPLLVGVVGKDANAEELRAIFRQSNISCDALVVDEDRPTTVKTRIIAGHQHVVRIDYEKRSEISSEISARIVGMLREHIASIRIIVLQDYDKGVMTPKLINEVIALGNEYRLPVLVDPKFKNFFAYRHVAVFKPNKKETEDALGVKMLEEEDFISAAKALQQRLNAGNILLTLGELGMLLLEENGTVLRVPTKAQKVADVSGAGDTVIATLATALAGGATMGEAAYLANFAGGLVCESVGIVPINPVLLREAALGRLGVKD
jgi:D-glycero-beta-D-manno-heptose-7-phosphate kinase